MAAVSPWSPLFLVSIFIILVCLFYNLSGVPCCRPRSRLFHMVVHVERIQLSNHDADLNHIEDCMCKQSMLLHVSCKRIPNALKLLETRVDRLVSRTTNLHVARLFMVVSMLWSQSNIQRLVTSISNVSLIVLKNMMQSLLCNLLVTIRATSKRAVDPNNPTSCNTNSNLVTNSRTFELV